jgi:hypothetical protein
MQPVITMTAPPTHPPSFVLPSSNVSGDGGAATNTVEATQAASIPQKAAPTWISIPDADISIDVSALPMTEAQRQARYWVPPNVPNAFWVDSYDQPGAGSVDLSLIVAHACEGLAVCDTIDWQFGRLSDASRVKSGTAINITTPNGRVCFTADSGPATYEKDRLQKHAVEVWGKAPRPGKLVLISCYTGDIHEKNVVIVASLTACSA